MSCLSSAPSKSWVVVSFYKSLFVFSLKSWRWFPWKDCSSKHYELFKSKPKNKIPSSLFQQKTCWSTSPPWYVWLWMENPLSVWSTNLSPGSQVCICVCERIYLKRKHSVLFQPVLLVPLGSLSLGDGGWRSKRDATKLLQPQRPEGHRVALTRGQSERLRSAGVWEQHRDHTSRGRRCCTL